MEKLEQLPRWLFPLYCKLWVKNKSSWFSFEEVVKLLKKNDTLTSKILFDLKKAGWLEVKKDPNNSKKRLYKLINPLDAINSIGK